jgi:hypothetical protein
MSTWEEILATSDCLTIEGLKRKGQGSQHTLRAFSLLRPRPDHEGTHHAEPLRHEPCPHVLSLRLVRGGAPGTRSSSCSN